MDDNFASITFHWESYPLDHLVGITFNGVKVLIWGASMFTFGLHQKYLCSLIYRVVINDVIGAALGANSLDLFLWGLKVTIWMREVVKPDKNEKNVMSTKIVKHMRWLLLFTFIYLYKYGINITLTLVFLLDNIYMNNI